MATHLELLTQTIPQLFELCHTIQEAAVHGAQKPETAAAMKGDIQAGIRAVESAARQIDPETLPAPVELDKLSDLEGDALAAFVNDCFFKKMGSYLVRQFQRVLKEENQFHQEDAETIAHWILNQMPVQPAVKWAMLLELGTRCGVWAPEFSWTLMSQVMDTMPPEEQKKIFPHWTGAPYRPGLHPQTELKHCPICGGNGVPYLTVLSGQAKNFDSLFLPVKMWMRCQSCGNLYTRYFPTEFLQLGARPKVLQPTPHYMVTREVGASSLRIWSDILNKIRGYTDGKTLLEVGVGEGHLIAVAQEMGYEVTAVELIEADAQETADLLELPVICGDFLHLEEKDLQVDIITMGDVLEHLQRPTEGLQKAHTLLKDNGILWLSTPNFESSFSKMMKVNDAMRSEPYHIAYFSRKGLVALLEKVGFELLEYSVSNRYNGSMELLLRKVPAQ